MAISQTITDIPTPPSSSDATNFRTRADAFMASLDTLATELNTFGTQANALETNVNAKEASATSSASIALASSNFKGAWDISTAYTVPSSVLHGGTYYMALIGSTGQTPPNATYWSPINISSNISYDNTASGITATNVQTAIDEIVTEKAPIASPAFTGTPTAHGISYKPTPVTITSWSYVTTTITLNVASHTFIAGDYIEVSGLTATTNVPNGVHLVTSVTATTIVFTYALTPTGTAGVSSATVKGYTTINGRTNGIGEGQTWQDVTASRAVGTTYTNTTGKPISVIIGSAFVANYNHSYYINGVNVGTQTASTSGGAACFSFIVPNGSTYSVVNSAISKWMELR